MILRRFVVRFPLVVLAALSLPSAACRNEAALRQAVFEAEESRAPEAASLRILLDASEDKDAGVRRTAVRALGRLVRPELVGLIAPMLNDPDPTVRSEAANALAQCVQDEKPDESTAGKSVFRFLESRLNREKAPAVRGVLLRSIGRLACCARDAEFRGAEKTLSAGSEKEGPEAYGALKGIESLYRRKSRDAAADGGVVARLKATASAGAGEKAGADEKTARLRRLALTALSWAGGLDEETLASAAADPDEQVRRLVFWGMGRLEPERIPGDAAKALVLRGLDDPSGMVRYEALRVYGRMGSAEDPSPVIASLDDDFPHVALLAIDLIGRLKNAPASVAMKLQRIAEEGSAGEESAADASAPRSRHLAARALAALAAIAPKEAGGLLAEFLSAPEWIVRTWAARAAAVLGDTAALESLFHDDHDNVRTAALSGLIELRGRAADGLCLAALKRSDYQLILTACGGLKGTPDAEQAVPRLLSALGRITAEMRETSRDPRLALLERLGELGSAEQAGALAPYARDFDPRIAAAAADIVGCWTGKAPAVEPKRLPIAFARLVDVEKLRGAAVRVTMAGGGTFDLSLHVDEAPATVARFTTLVRNGYYDGLTFHRVVPNFLIQGGSPGANEYVGDGPFLRDESGLESNLRGAVGISTRGRDTGDAQIYINTIDSDRLDHDYCVFGRVTSGMDVVDRILEGDVIRKMELIRSAGGRNG